MKRLLAICLVTAVATLAAMGLICAVISSLPPEPQQSRPRSDRLKKIDSLSAQIKASPDRAELFFQRAQATLSHISDVLASRTSNPEYTYNDVLEDLNAAVRLDPDMGDAYLEKGWVLTSQLWVGKELFGGYNERQPKAVEAFSRAIELLDDPSWAYLGRADARWVLGKREEGRRDLRAIMDLAPLDSEIYRALEDVSFRMGDYRILIDARTKADFLENCESEVTAEDLAALELNASAFEPVSVDQDTAEVNQAKLQLAGVWHGDMHVSRFGVDGPDTCRLTIDGTQGMLEIESPMGSGKASFLIRVNPLATPMAIDAVVSSGDHDVLGRSKGTALGILELSGNQLKMCFAFDTAPRPTEFSHREPHPYQRLFLLQQD